jgi:hypothetical protein
MGLLCLVDELCFARWTNWFCCASSGSGRAASLSGWTGFVGCKINKLLLVFTWLSSCVECKERQHRVQMEFLVPLLFYTPPSFGTTKHIKIFTVLCAKINIDLSVRMVALKCSSVTRSRRIFKTRFPRLDVPVVCWLDYSVTYCALPGGCKLQLSLEVFSSWTFTYPCLINGVGVLLKLRMHVHAYMRHATRVCVCACVCRRASQQMLRTHRSLEAYCATLWWRWFNFFFVFPCNGAPVEWNWRGKNLSQWHFVHHKSHMDWPGIEPGPPRWEAGD